MRCLPLTIALIFVATTAVAFTQHETVRFYSPPRMSQTLRTKTFGNFMNTYEYCEPTDLSLEDQKELLKSRMPQPVDDNMSKYQIEFRELLEGILYTEKEIQTILNPRMRSILEGIAASYYEPAVYRAFEILYEDYVPLRVAGRVVYRELRKVMDDSKHYQKSQIDAIIEATGMARSEIEDCWFTYTKLTNERKLSFSDIEKHFGPQMLNLVRNSNAVSISSKSKERSAMSFRELLTCLHHNKISGSGNGSPRIHNENQSAENILQQALDLGDAIEHRNLQEQNPSAKYQEYNKRYDDMLVQFSKWKPLIPSGNGRRLEIMKGCFVGSENSAVVEALRIIYVDYTALRLAGDFIFKIVSALMRPVVRRHNSRQKSLLR